VHVSVEPVLERLVDALERIEAALELKDPDAADEALVAVARLDTAHDDLVAALEAAGDAARLSPRRRRALGGLDRYAVDLLRASGLERDEAQELVRRLPGARARRDVSARRALERRARAAGRARVRRRGRRASRGRGRAWA
jgi:hypothetical protein